jgi:uncharacterized membrane protein
VAAAVVVVVVVSLVSLAASLNNANAGNPDLQISKIEKKRES